ncbi:hypothetical protein ACFU99_19825, partial [Streptomyces sp. NPDC057654]
FRYGLPGGLLALAAAAVAATGVIMLTIEGSKQEPERAEQPERADGPRVPDELRVPEEPRVPEEAGGASAETSVPRPAREQPASPAAAVPA